jgi:LysR family glycine cleavage system transcriptional activator
MNEWVQVKTISAVPLNGLRAFEVAARHMSIKDAARELHLTPSAVSHRLRQLEKIIGLRLFERAGSKLQLTEAGRKLAPSLSEGFAQIIAALREVQQVPAQKAKEGNTGA